MKRGIMEKQLRSVCDKFLIEGKFDHCELITNGHINKTYKVFFDCDGTIKDYIIQRINTYVFKNPVEVMRNISNVTEYVRAKIKERLPSAKRYVLHYRQTGDGLYYYIDENGGFWRCCRFIDDSVTFQSTDNLKVVEESGKAFGEFQMYLAEYPVKDLYVSIPHFHNTVMRYETFKKSVAENLSGRAENVRAEIAEYLALEDVATKMYKMQKRGELPLKVTHNDTKCNNVLFDKDTFEHLSVVDLDTVMPGLVAFDFGDAIRFTANTCAEDEKDVTKVALDFDKYDAFAKGFLGCLADTLTQKEKDTMALGAVTMTVECGMRFLTDYIDGDKYFGVDYADHNLVRSRTQLALAKDMLAHFDEMNAVVKKYC